MAMRKKNTPSPREQALMKMDVLVVDTINNILDKVDRYIAKRLATSTTAPKFTESYEYQYIPVNEQGNVPVDPNHYFNKLKKWELLRWSKTKGGTVWAHHQFTGTFRYLGPFDWEGYRNGN